MYCVEEETNKKKTVSESESESYKLGTKKIKKENLHSIAIPRKGTHTHRFITNNHATTTQFGRNVGSFDPIGCYASVARILI